MLFRFCGRKYLSTPQLHNPNVCTNKSFSELPVAKVPVSGNDPVWFPDPGLPAKFRFPHRAHRLLCKVRWPKFAPDIPLWEHLVKNSKHPQKQHDLRWVSEPESR